jgi:hypothetical protein
VSQRTQRLADSVHLDQDIRFIGGSRWVYSAIDDGNLLLIHGEALVRGRDTCATVRENALGPKAVTRGFCAAPEQGAAHSVVIAFVVLQDPDT